jgi:hypothetical protein
MPSICFTFSIALTPSIGFDLSYVPQGAQPREKVMKLSSAAARLVALVGGTAIVAIDPAFAGIDPVGVPAPLVGAGIPALLAFAGGYWAIRKRRKG